MKKINVFCFPFAGGNKYSYRIFQQHALSHLNIVPLEYAGRGSRSIAPLMCDIHEMAFDTYHQIREMIVDEDYVIYGHSMGAIVAFECLHLAIKDKQRLPLHFFASGAVGPSSSSRQTRNWYQLPRDKFIAKLKELEGCPEEIFSHPELLDFIEPIIRSDFRAMETYQYVKRPRLELPVTVITGTDEKMPEEELYLWRDETSHEVDFRKMNGKHFFIFDDPKNNILRFITHKLFPHKNEYV